MPARHAPGSRRAPGARQGVGRGPPARRGGGRPALRRGERPPDRSRLGRRPPRHGGRRRGGAGGGRGCRGRDRPGPPAQTPTVEIAEASAPDLYRMVRDLATRLSVPAPSAIALTPDCDSWLEDRAGPSVHGGGSRADGDGPSGPAAAPVLVIGSPFLWWMRVGELRAVLAPVVAGTGASVQPDIAAARRFVRGLDAAVALAARPGLGAVRRLGARAAGAVARPMLSAVRGHAAEMERGVAAAASEQGPGRRLRPPDRRAGAGRPRLRGLGPPADPRGAARLAHGPLAVPAGRRGGGGAHRTVPARPARRGVHVPARRAAGLRPAGGTGARRRGGLPAGGPALPRRARADGA